MVLFDVDLFSPCFYMESPLKLHRDLSETKLVLARNFLCTGCKNHVNVYKKINLDLQKLYLDWSEAVC